MTTVQEVMDEKAQVVQQFTGLANDVMNFARDHPLTAAELEQKHKNQVIILAATMGIKISDWRIDCYFRAVYGTEQGNHPATPSIDTYFKKSTEERQIDTLLGDKYLPNVNIIDLR